MWKSRKSEGQIDDLITEINRETDRKNKVLVTTLTKRMAEDLTDYLKKCGHTREIPPL